MAHGTNCSQETTNFNNRYSNPVNVNLDSFLEDFEKMLDAEMKFKLSNDSNGYQRNSNDNIYVYQFLKELAPQLVGLDLNRFNNANIDENIKNSLSCLQNNIRTTLDNLLKSISNNKRELQSAVKAYNSKFTKTYKKCKSLLEEYRATTEDKIKVLEALKDSCHEYVFSTKKVSRYWIWGRKTNGDGRGTAMLLARNVIDHFIQYFKEN